MQNQRVLPALSVGLLLLVGATTTAHASPIYYAFASAGVSEPFGPGDSESTGFVNNSDSAGPVSADLPGGFASASVTDGELHAFATSSGVGIAANGSAGFFDTLLLTSATLAPGTLVSLLGELDFSATVTPNGQGEPCSNVSVASGALEAQTLFFAAGTLTVQDSSCDSFDFNNATALIQGIIGEELTVSTFLGVGVGGFAAGTADASNTLRFFLTPIGDFTYSTASGNNYINQVHPVPEPSSLLLFGSGLTFAVSRLRRRSTRR